MSMRLRRGQRPSYNPHRGLFGTRPYLFSLSCGHRFAIDEHGIFAGITTLTLARWQFGVTTVFHFLFVPLTIVSVSWACLQTRVSYAGRALRPHGSFLR